MLGRKEQQPIGPVEPHDGTTMQEQIMARMGGFSESEIAALQGQPVPFSKIQRGRGLDATGPIKDYVPLTPPALSQLGFNAVQQFPSDEQGNWQAPGLLAVMELPYKPRSGSGWKHQTVMAFDSAWMPGKLGLQLEGAAAARKGEYYPHGDDDAFVLIFRYNPDRLHPLTNIPGHDEKGDWELVDRLMSSDAHHSTGGVDLLMPDPRDPSQSPRDIPVVGLLKDLTFPEQERFRQKYGREGYRDKLDTLITKLGRHLIPAHQYDYTKDKSLSEDDRILCENFLNANQEDPLTLAVVLLAFREYMKLDLHEARKEKSDEGLSKEEKQRIEDRRDEIREEVLEAVNVSIFDDSLSQILPTGDGSYIHPKRWGARIITKDDITALHDLAQVRPGTPPEQEPEPYQALAKQLCEQMKGQTKATLFVEETSGNTLIKSLSYKPGETDRQTKGTFQYVSGMHRCVPVHASLGAYPMEIEMSFLKNSKPNMVAGIIGELTTKGPMMANGNEKYLLVDALASHAKIALGALRYYRTLRQQLQETGSAVTVMKPPTLSQLLTANTGPLNVTVATSSEKGLQARFALDQKTGIVMVHEQNGHGVRFEASTAYIPEGNTPGSGKNAGATETQSTRRIEVVPRRINAQAGEVAIAGLYNFGTLHGRVARRSEKLPIGAVAMPNNASRLKKLIQELNPPQKDYNAKRRDSVVPFRGRRGRGRRS